MRMDAVRSRLRDLAQAVAQGRLALAEVAAISGDELDAIYETAVMRLDTGRPAEGAKMLAALVVLYPFAHEYWRAYAVALARLGEVRAALKARDMSRSIARVQGAEVAAELLGETGHLEATNPNIDGQKSTEVTATDIGGASSEVTHPHIEGSLEITEPHIDGRASTSADETTGTGARRGAEPTQPGIEPVTEPRITWPAPDDESAQPEVTPRPMANERSMTAIVDRRPRPMEHGGDTARIDRRTRKRVQAAPIQYDDSLTAIVRRRTGAPLGEDV